MLENKIVEYSSIGEDKSDVLKIDDFITLSFADENKVTEKAIKSE